MVKPELIRAHENFPANNVLHERGSATSDEVLAVTDIAFMARRASR
jgi:hypothetical protein